jgi:hypothetical protein
VARHLGFDVGLQLRGIDPCLRWGIFQKSATSPNFETADSEHNSNTLYIVHHDLLNSPTIMANSLKDALT